jgi:hypothetical protein
MGMGEHGQLSGPAWHGCVTGEEDFIDGGND